MDIKSLAQLRQLDPRSALGMRLSSDADGERVAEYHQRLLAHLDLAEGVPGSVADSFERLRTIYGLSVLCYDLYTVAHDDARLVLELALRERFVAHYPKEVAFVDKRGARYPVTAERFDQVYDAVHEDHRLHKHKWRLVVSTGEPIYFDGMLDSLLRWARREGLLHGEGNRHYEKHFKKRRDSIAHPAAYHLLPPSDAAQAISDLAELINHLWGESTPGGRLYPAPVERAVHTVAWTRDEEMVTWPLAEWLPEMPREWTGPNVEFVLVRAKIHDDQLAYFDALFESTHYPCEWLWGPGSWSEAVAWLERERPQGDQVDILDRHFLVQYRDGRLYLPRRPGIAAACTGDDREGRWYLLRADSPLPAFNHLRQRLAGGFGCAEKGPCVHCPVDTVFEGSWQEALDRLTELTGPITPETRPDVRTPSSQPRWNENIGDGTWSVPL